MARRAELDDAERDLAISGELDRDGVAADLDKAGIKPTETLSPGCSPRPASTPSAATSRTSSASGSPSSTSRRTSSPGCPTASTSARSTSWPPTCAGRAWHDAAPARPASARWWPAPTAPPPSTSTRCSPTADVDIIVCCGSGGVGKTTTSAALALRAAEQGRKVVVLTIDPARAAGPVDGHREARQRPAAGARASRRRRRLARRDDAGHEAHLRRGGREPGQPREGRADPGEPVLRRALQLVRGHPGVHGDGEARPAATPTPGAPAAGT